ncbi:MAG: hypothetical protein ACJ76J_16020 [Thermoanaerobaculia bacterium]
MRRFGKLILFLLVLLVIAGHILRSYWPRERPATPDPDGLPARLMASGSYEACFWVPYPHQNVGELSEVVDDGSAWLEAAARVAGVPPPVLPSFGPFAVPPSKEIVVCSDLDGERFFVAADVYPGLGAVAKAAGTVADNPWLAGGEITESRGTGNAVVERVLRVAWNEGVWTVTGGDGPPVLGPVKQPLLHPRSLGIVRLEREISGFSDGDYLLRRRDGDLELARASSEPAPNVPDPAVEGERPVLLAVSGASWPDAEPRPLPPAAFALFATGEGEGAKFGPFGSLPGAAIFHPPGSKRFSLPGEGLAGLIAGGLPRSEVAGWQILAMDSSSMRKAETLAPRLAELAPPDVTEALNRDGRLLLGLWLQPRPAVLLVARVRKFLEKVPIVDRQQVRNWKDWETLLMPIARCEQVTLAATQKPASFRLRLHGCR